MPMNLLRLTQLYFFYLILAIAAPITFTQAQQNLFNVPSSEITKPSDFLFQEQINFTADEWQSNTIFSYGLGKNFEVGFNVLGLRFNPSFRDSVLLTNDDIRVEPLHPALLLNAQKAFPLSQVLQLAIGTQIGTNAGAHRALINYNYLNLAIDLKKTNTRIMVGGHTFTKAFAGDACGRELSNANNPLFPGFQLGIDQSLIKDKLKFIADFISGRHTLGEISGGLEYVIHHQWDIAFGYQLPNPNSLAQQGLIFQLTYFPE